MTSEPHIHDRVAIRSTDGFNGKQGVLDRIAPTGALRDQYTYWVDFGMKWYGRKVVPFQRSEVQKVVKCACGRTLADCDYPDC